MGTVGEAQDRHKRFGYEERQVEALEQIADVLTAQFEAEPATVARVSAPLRERIGAYMARRKDKEERRRPRGRQKA